MTEGRLPGYVLDVEFEDGSIEIFDSLPGETRAEMIMRLVREYPNWVLESVEWDRGLTFETLDKETRKN